MVQNATIKINHKPGHRLEVDFAGKKLNWTDITTGELIACAISVCTLPFSAFKYVCAVLSQQRDYFMKGINQAVFSIIQDIDDVFKIMAGPMVLTSVQKCFEFCS